MVQGILPQNLTPWHFIKTQQEILSDFPFEAAFRESSKIGNKILSLRPQSSLPVPRQEEYVYL